MEVWRYGEFVLSVSPMERLKSCSLGRYALLIGREPLGGWNAEQAVSLRKAFLSDLQAFMGELPKTIFGIDCAQQG